MNHDEHQIRQLVATWMTATKAGDVATVLSLMTDDVVFLTAGRPPMDKEQFAAQARAQIGVDSPQIEGSSEIQEIRVFGHWAFLWSRLSLVVTPPSGALPVKRAGHTLTILQKVDGRWLLARDANLLVTQS